MSDTTECKLSAENARTASEQGATVKTGWWRVAVYGFGDARFQARSRDAARYQAFKAIREAGWFNGRDGFWRFLANGVSVTPLPPEPTP